MAHTTRRTLLQAEALERRETPAIDVNGMLVTVNGDETGVPTDDTVTLAFNANGQFVVTLSNALKTESRPFGPNQVSQVTVIALRGSNTLNVEGTNVAVFVQSDGTDTVHLSPTARDLDNVQGLVTFDHGSTDDVVILYDQADTSGAEYDFSYGHVRSTGSSRTFGGLDYTHDSQEIRLHVRDSGAVVNVTAGPVVGTTKLFGGAGNDTFDFEFETDPRRPGYLGRYEVVGNGMTDSVDVEVTAPQAGLNEYEIGSGAIGWNERTPATAPPVDRVDVTYTSVESMRLRSLGAPADFRLTASPGLPMTIEGSAGEDTFRSTSADNFWILAGETNSWAGGVALQYVEHLRGGSGNDRFTFQPGGRTWSSIDGGAGTDTFDYTALSAGVTVDLGIGSASQISGLVGGIEHVTGTKFADNVTGDIQANQLRGLEGNDSLFGGDGNDILWAGDEHDRAAGGNGDDIIYGGMGNDRLDGNDGNDVLFGGNGDDRLMGGLNRDILFGGPDRDIVDGGAADDIVASGSLRFEEILAQVQLVRAEWASSHSYADRVANLRGRSSESTTWGSRLNQNSFLTIKGTLPTVIHGPSAQDLLTGGAAKAPDLNQDWFFGLSAEFLDRQANEEANG